MVGGPRSGELEAIICPLRLKEMQAYNIDIEQSATVWNPNLPSDLHVRHHTAPWSQYALTGSDVRCDNEAVV